MKEQLNLGEKQADISASTLAFTERAFAVTERPYLGIKNLTVVEPPEAGKDSLRIGIELVNIGRTPAYNITGTLNYTISNVDTPQALMEKYTPEYAILPITERVGQIESGGTYRMRDARLTGITIDAAILDGLWHLHNFCYVYGEIRYQDHVGKKYVFPHISVLDYDVTSHYPDIFECEWETANTRWAAPLDYVGTLTAQPDATDPSSGSDRPES